ncbi:hypothetical protein [Pelagibius sp.]|uniref:hypothetical protein n=1 Tax=Pelagibius sp. TaxID=1931238 RepID=UPI003B502025
MILRLGLNFGAHLLAGVAFGALAACAAKSCMRKDRAHEGHDHHGGHDHHAEPDAPDAGGGAAKQSA